MDESKIELRDYFAGQALAMAREDILALPEFQQSPEAALHEMAKLAYAIADAMLDVRDSG